MLLAGVLSVPLGAGMALAAETGGLSLAEAAKLGDRGAVRSLLAGRGKADVPGPNGTAALIWAAERNDAEMADLFLAAGVDVKGTNELGATALYAAAANADPAMTARLLTAGADANARLLSGEAPLMEAARRGNIATLRALLAGGANPNAQEVNGGQNALMWAASERHPAVTEALVQRGADVHTRSKAGFTALMFAAQQGDVASARILLAAGAKPNDVVPRNGLTPLIVASAMGSPEVAEVLLDNGADPNAVDATGFTSLHHAARDKDAVRTVRALLAHGGKPDVRLSQAKPTMAPSGITLRGSTPLALAAEINNLGAVMALVEGGADPQIPTDQNTTPLMLAAGAGTDVSRPRPSEERETAVQTVAFLIDRGADVNAAGQFGWTPLHAAAYQGLNDVIEYLAGKGAKLDAKDSFGQTALSISNGVVTPISAALTIRPHVMSVVTLPTAFSNSGPRRSNNPGSWSSTSSPRNSSPGALSVMRHQNGRQQFDFVQ